MIRFASNSGTSKLEEVIEGIMDADISEVQKQNFLKRINNEGGVCSQQLREDLIRLFDEQVAKEQQITGDNNALLGWLDIEKVAAGSLDDSAEAPEISNEMMVEQRRITENFKNAVQTVQNDVRRMERDASQKKENERSLGDTKAIEQIREELQK